MRVHSNPDRDSDLSVSADSEKKPNKKFNFNEYYPGFHSQSNSHKDDTPKNNWVESIKTKNPFSFIGEIFLSPFTSKDLEEETKDQDETIENPKIFEFGS